MREQTPAHFVGLDIGTQNVRCVVGMLDGEKDTSQISVIGHGSAKSQGMRRGVVVHVDDVTEAVSTAINEAERLSGIKIDQATVNINGSHVNGVNSRGVIAISSPNREITEDDRMRVEEAAAIMQLPANREIIQVFAKNYRLDGQDNIKNPIGMQGVRLEVDTHIVTVSTPLIRSLDMVMEKTGLKPSHHTVSSLAASEAVLTREQKEAGTLLLDIGAGTTNILVVEDGEVEHVAVIPVGGLHITNDLAIGLKTDLDIAEKVKIEHASLSGKPETKNCQVEKDGKVHRFELSEVRLIAEARVEELLELVEKELKRIHRSRKLPGGVVLVGGTANLPGIDEFTKDVLQLPARIGELQPLNGIIDSIQEPEFFTAIGLMLLDMLLLPQQTSSYKELKKPISGVINSIGRFLGR